MIKQRILGHFQEGAELNTQAATSLAQPIAQAVALMFAGLSNGSRILACGNGGSAAVCQYFAAQLVGSFERERLALPALALSTDASILSAIGSEPDFDQVFARQVQAFGQASEPDVASTKAIDDGEHVAGIATQSVKLPNGQHVAGAKEVEAGV